MKRNISPESRKRMSEAAKSFCSSLTPEQKRAKGLSASAKRWKNSNDYYKDKYDTRP